MPIAVEAPNREAREQLFKKYLKTMKIATSEVQLCSYCATSKLSLRRTCAVLVLRNNVRNEGYCTCYCV
jgi:hypothetical protein